MRWDDPPLDINPVFPGLRVIIIIIIIILLLLFYCITTMIFNIYLPKLWKHTLWVKQSWVFHWIPLCLKYVYSFFFTFLSSIFLYICDCYYYYYYYYYLYLRVVYMCRPCWGTYKILSRFKSCFVLVV